MSEMTHKLTLEKLEKHEKRPIGTQIDLCAMKRSELQTRFRGIELEDVESRIQNAISADSVDWMEIIFGAVDEDRVELLTGWPEEFNTAKRRLADIGFAQKLSDKLTEFKAFLKNMLTSCDALHRNSVLHLFYTFEIDAKAYLMFLRVPLSVISNNVALNDTCIWVYTDSSDHRQYFVEFNSTSQLLNFFDRVTKSERTQLGDTSNEMEVLASLFYKTTSCSVVRVLESQRSEVDSLDFDRAFRLARASMLKKSFEEIDDFVDLIFVEKRNCLLMMVAYLMSKEKNDNAFIETCLALDECLKPILAINEAAIYKNFDLVDSKDKKADFVKAYKAFLGNEVDSDCAKFAFTIDNYLLNNCDFHVGRYVLVYLMHKIAKLGVQIWISNGSERFVYEIPGGENCNLFAIYIHADTLTNDNYYFFLNKHEFNDFEVNCNALYDIWNRENWTKMMMLRGKGLSNFLSK